MRSRKILMSVVIATLFISQVKSQDVNPTGMSYNRLSFVFGGGLSFPINETVINGEKNADSFAEAALLLKYRTGYRTSIFTGVRYHSFGYGNHRYSWNSIEIPLSFGYVFKLSDSYTYMENGKRTNDVVGFKINIGLNYNISTLTFDDFTNFPDRGTNNNLSGFLRLGYALNDFAEFYVKYTNDITEFDKQSGSNIKRSYFGFGTNLKIKGLF